MSETITPEAVELTDGTLRRVFRAEMTAGDGRTIDVRVVPYGERIQHNDGLGGVARGVTYTEEWMFGAFSDQVAARGREQKIYANFEHEQGIRGIVGHGLALREASDGLHGSFKLHETPDGEKALYLVREGLVDGVSLEAKPKRSVNVGGVVQRVKAHLYGIALTRQGAYQGARVLAVREPILNAEHLPTDPDPELIERCRRLGIRIPQRYEAHPEGHPDTVGTPEDGTRPDANTTSSEGT